MVGLLSTYNDCSIVIFVVVVVVAVKLYAYTVLLIHMKYIMNRVVRVKIMARIFQWDVMTIETTIMEL
jgi:hypothetical protein